MRIDDFDNIGVPVDGDLLDQVCEIVLSFKACDGLFACDVINLEGIDGVGYVLAVIVRQLLIDDIWSEGEHEFWLIGSPPKPNENHNTKDASAHQRYRYIIALIFISSINILIYLSIYLSKSKDKLLSTPYLINILMHIDNEHTKTQSKKFRTQDQTKAVHAEAFAVSCMDFRLVDDMVYFMDGLGYNNNYDQFVLAGASLGFTQEKYPSWGQALLDHLAIGL